ncbi:diguanylate cyclase [Pseudomonas sp. RW405]|nr:diguanylate cyclase [Pseudomonas sp. RW405]
MGAGFPANTGEARAIHHGVGFAGKPASTPPPLAPAQLAQ